MSADDLRAAIEQLADEWDALVIRAGNWYSPREGGMTDAYIGAARRLRALLAEHPAPERPAACEICLRAGCRGECRVVPAPEPPSECATPTCPACYPAGGEVTADEIYDVLHQSWLASPEFLPDHRAAADAILARFHVNPRADA